MQPVHKYVRIIGEGDGEQEQLKSYIWPQPSYDDGPLVFWELREFVNQLGYSRKFYLHEWLDATAAGRQQMCAFFDVPLQDPLTHTHTYIYICIYITNIYIYIYMHSCMYVHIYIACVCESSVCVHVYVCFVCVLCVHTYVLFLLTHTYMLLLQIHIHDGDDEDDDDDG